MRDSEPYAKTARSHTVDSSKMDTKMAFGEFIDNALDADGAPRLVTIRDGEGNKYLIVFNTGEPPKELSVLMGLGLNNITKPQDKIGFKGRGGMSAIWLIEPTEFIAIASDGESLCEFSFACNKYVETIRTYDEERKDISDDCLKPNQKPWKINEGGITKKTENLINFLAVKMAYPDLKNELTALLTCTTKGLIQMFKFEPTHKRFGTIDKELLASVPLCKLFHGEILKARDINIMFELHDMPKKKGKHIEYETQFICLDKSNAVDVMMDKDYININTEFGCHGNIYVAKFTISNKKGTMTPWVFYSSYVNGFVKFTESYEDWNTAEKKGSCDTEFGYLNTKLEEEQKKALETKIDELRGYYTYYNKRGCGLGVDVKGVRSRDGGGIRVVSRIENNQYIANQVLRVCNFKSQTNDSEIPLWFKEPRDLMFKAISDLIQEQKPHKDSSKSVLTSWSPVWDNLYREAIVKAIPLEGKSIVSKPRVKKNTTPVSGVGSGSLGPARFVRVIKEPAVSQPVLSMMGGSDFHGVLTPAIAEPVLLAQESVLKLQQDPLIPVIVHDTNKVDSTNISIKINSIEEPVLQNIITFSVNKNGNILVLKDEVEIAEIRPYTLPNHLQKELECMRKEIGTERFITFIPLFAKIYKDTRA